MDSIPDNEIECPRCGNSAYGELTHCPECGLNFYPLEGSDFVEDYDFDQPSWLGRLGLYPAAIILPWLSSTLVVFLLHLVARSFLISREFTLVENAFFLIGDLLISFGAGYLAGVLAEENQITHGLVSGVLISATRILFEAFWRDLNSISLLTPWLFFSWGAIMMGIWIGALLARNRSLRVDHILFESDERMFEKLLTKVGFDRYVAERLIEYERQRSPNANPRIWLQNAISRWDRDNRSR